MRTSSSSAAASWGSARPTTWRRGSARRRAGREGRARLGLDLQGGRRGAGAVLRRGQHRARARSLETFETFARRFGQEIDLHQVGYLFLLDDPTHVAAFEANVALQNELGVPSRMIDVAEAKASLAAHRAPTGSSRRRGSPDDGHCTPESVVLGYAGGRAPSGRPAGDATARSPGSRSGDGAVIAAVRTRPGPIRDRHRRLRRRRLVGGRRLLVGRRPAGRAAAPADPGHRAGPGLDPRHARSPSTSPPASTSTARARGSSLGMSDPDETPGFKLGRSDDWLPRLGEAIERRAPALADVGIVSRLGRALRDDARPQRAGRRGPGRLPVPLRHRLLRPRVPDGAGGRRGDARPLPGPSPRRRRRALAADRFAGS